MESKPLFKKWLDNSFSLEYLISSRDHLTPIGIVDNTKIIAAGNSLL
jgi:hypothetical protein